MKRWRVHINGAFFRRSGEYEISVTTEPNCGWGWHSLHKQIICKGVNQRQNRSALKDSPYHIFNLNKQEEDVEFARDLAQYKRALRQAAIYAEALNRSKL